MTNKTVRRTLEFPVGGNFLEHLKDLPGGIEAEEFGIFRSGDNGATFGRPLASYEYPGEGLPDSDEKNILHPKGEITFKFRFCLDGEGSLWFEVAQKGSGRHYRFPIPNQNFQLDPDGAHFAASRFEQGLDNYLYDIALFNLVLACFGRQTNNEEIQKKTLKSVTDHVGMYFDAVLKPKRFRVTGSTEKDGFKITTSESINAGRKPKPFSDLEAEKLTFLTDVFSAFRELQKNRIRAPKQKNLRPYIFKHYADGEQKISETLRKHRLNFKDIWQIYLSSADLNEFLSGVNPTK